MRLSQSERGAMEKSFLEVFGEGQLYLFGSRTDDTKKGGDIDLYIVPKSRENLASKKIDFLVKLKQQIGEQKIDLLLDRGGNRPIDIMAKNTRVLLCKH